MQNLNENEILDILNSFESEFQEREKDSKRELQEIRFYTEFEIKGIKDAEISGVFFTEELDEDGNKTYHLYYQDPSNEILSIDSKGIVQISEKWKEVIGDIDFEKTMKLNDQDNENLKGISTRAKPDEMKETLKKQEKPDIEQDDKTQEIEQSLNENGEDLGITNFREIKDSYISEKMPEAFKDGEENGIAFSKKLNRFVIISKVNGQYQLNENIEPAQMTWRTTISLDANGEKIERKVPYALMQLPNNQEKEIAVTLDEYGDADIETVSVLPCQERVSRAVRMDREGIEQEESLEMRTEAQNQGRYYEYDIAHGVKEAEDVERNQGKTVDYERTEDDYIPNTNKTWRELMDETGESLPKLLERYDNEMKVQGTESEEAVETIEQDYGRLPGTRENGMN